MDEFSDSFVQLCAESPKDRNPLPLSRPVTVLHHLTCEEVSPHVQSELLKVATRGHKVKIKVNTSGPFSQMCFLLLHTLVCIHYTPLLKTSRHHFTQQEL